MSRNTTHSATKFLSSIKGFLQKRSAHKEHKQEERIAAEQLRNAEQTMLDSIAVNIRGLEDILQGYRDLKAREDQLAYEFDSYEGRWRLLKSGRIPNSVFTTVQLPWPVIMYDDTIDITHEKVEEFVFHPLRPGLDGKSRHEVLKTELLRYHPDKFNSGVLSKLRESERSLAAELACTVTRILNEMMSAKLER